MQTTKIPASFYEDIEKLCRMFIREYSKSNHKVHLISWNQICQPTDSEGLGIRHMRSTNDALLTKLVWDLILNIDSP